MSANPTYSICMCNYNMADTLERSLTSLLTQLDEDYEVVLVDDGSTDDSVAIVKRLQKKYSKLRLISLPRDPNRKLGLTRNISIKEAKGEYVILHLDCDDIFGPHIKDFVKVFENITACLDKDLLLSGQHINIARRDFLLSHGPYLNIYRGEDRNLWSRLAKINAWVPLDHVDFIVRIPKKTKKRLIKNIIDTFDHMKNDFRSGVTLVQYIKYEISKRHIYSAKLFIFRLSMLIPSWLLSRFKSPIPQDDTLGSPEEFAAYREKTRGTYSEIMQRHGGDGSLDFLETPESKRIFANRN